MSRFRIALLLVSLLPACDVSASGPSDEESWVTSEVPAGPSLRVAAVQFDARPQEPERNLAAMERLARAAAEGGARLVLFHENALLDYGPRVRELAEPVPDGHACRRLAALAAELEVWIGAGLPERDGDRVYVTHAFFGPEGYVASYRKTWLFHSKDHRRDEWAHFDPGTGPAAFELAGLRTVVLICSDAESRRCLEDLGALDPELVLFPNNRSNLHEPETFANIARRARAPVVLANRGGRSWQYDCNGGSCVLAADGSTLARANRVGREEILICDVPLGAGGRRPGR